MSTNHNGGFCRGARKYQFIGAADNQKRKFSMQVIKQDQVQEKIIIIRNQKVIIDADVAELYGVETKRVNEAAKNNPEKFPKGYLFKLNKQEKNKLVENFDRFKKLKHSTVLMMLNGLLKMNVSTLPKQEK